MFIYFPLIVIIFIGFANSANIDVMSTMDMYRIAGEVANKVIRRKVTIKL